MAPDAPPDPTLTPAPATAALLRALPAVEAVRRSPCWSGLPGALATTLAREAIGAVRDAIRAGAIVDVAAVPAALAAATARVDADLRGPLLRPLFNGSGVLLMTNAGRAPLAAAALEAIVETARGYATLELDPDDGHRGSRQELVRPLLRWLCRCEDALVVNNGAAALLLALHALAGGRPVLVSRGELIEIGGSFRVPEIVAASGAELVEVGTTNRTHCHDYAAAAAQLAAAGRPVAALLQVHRSNFHQEGFVATPSLAELAAVARAHGAPLVCDVGAGAVEPVAPWGLRAEPTLAETIAAGADLVTASGDKLIGGPQAGLILGRQELVQRCARAPLARALRPCRLTLAGLEPTLRAHLRGEATTALPLWRTIARPLAELQALGDQLAAATLACSEGGWSATIAASEAAVGGGSQPGVTLPSCALVLRRRGQSGEQLRRWLLGLPTPWWARARGDAVWLDLRSLTCGPTDAELARAWAEVLTGSQRST